MATAAVALSACAGTMLPAYDDAAPMLTTTTDTTTSTTTAAPSTTAPATSAHIAEPAAPWLPDASMSVDEVMYGTVEDAELFWLSDPDMPNLGGIDAAPGGVDCEGNRLGASNPAAYCNGAIRWDTSALRAEGEAMLPSGIRHWAVVITAAHEAGHHIEGSILADRTRQEHENVAECLAGVYIRHRFSTVASADDIMEAYGALGRDARVPDNAVPEAFREGLLIDRNTAPTAAFKACARSWG
ncbi:hypothetical protein [Mycobacteroides abscessus]|uniref:hypothetical protein n=1 Tax=Mycobacteroides abscessus TaxID=36809 RepID=UPI001041D6FF|nr:hypothetical protein [Mycobacteroides abscessus]